MARGTLHFLSTKEIDLVHDTSLRILEEVGIVVRSESVTKMLLDAGARGSTKGDRILIPPSLVKSALSSAPKSIILASRDGKNDMKIPTQGPLFAANGGEGVYVKDLFTGAQRPSTLDDVRKFVTLVDMLPQIDFCWNMVGAIDVPISKKTVTEVAACFETSKKHLQGGATSKKEAEDTVEMLMALGDMDEFAKRPFYSAVQCPISPLSFEEGLAEAQVILSRAGVPVVAMVAAVTGLTSPVTISGSLAQINAENLSSLVISQVAKKGAPWVYSSDSAPGDLRTGSISYGSIEGPLIRTGAGQMGRNYGLPVMCGGISMENAAAHLSSASEGVPHLAPMSLIPTDLSSGFGGVDQAAGASFEVLIADAWAWDLTKEFIREFDFDAESISFETIRAAAMDGNFLGKRHTLARFKKESAAVMKPGATFTDIGGDGRRGDLLKKAREEVSRLLAMPHAPATTRDETLALDSIVRRA